MAFFTKIKYAPHVVVKNIGCHLWVFMSSPEIPPVDPALEHGSRPGLRPKVARKRPCLPLMISMEKISRKVFRGMTQDKQQLKSRSLSSRFIFCFIFRSFEGEMTTPRNSMSGAFPADSTKGPMATQPVQRTVPKRIPSTLGPTQTFFLRESKALGVSQPLSIPYPRHSLASGSRCWRPGTGLRPT